jgi:hypothetical protein
MDKDYGNVVLVKLICIMVNTGMIKNGDTECLHGRVGIFIKATMKEIFEVVGVKCFGLMEVIIVVIGIMVFNTVKVICLIFRINIYSRTRF